jgi:hypothetical protein
MGALAPLLAPGGSAWVAVLGTAATVVVAETESG